MSVEERDAYMNETHALFTHIDTSERRKLALAKQAAEQQLERIDEGPPASLCEFYSLEVFTLVTRVYSEVIK